MSTKQQAAIERIILDVNVTRSATDADTLEYSLSESSKGNDGHLDDDNVIVTYYYEEVEFQFSLCDKTGLGLFFTNDQYGPFWIKAGSNPKTCPSNHFIAPGFDVDVLDDHNFVVTNPPFRPRNPRVKGEKKDFVYRIRITQPGPRNRDWDPVIENGGGGPGRGWGRGGRDR